MAAKPLPMIAVARGAWRVTLATVLSLSLAACSKPVAPPQDASNTKAGPAIPVLMAKVQRKEMPRILQAIGNVEPYATVAVKARVDGQIVEASFRDGQDVHKGQLLFQIDPRPFQAQLKQAEATLARDRAQLERARAQEKRYQDLLARNFVSRDAYAQFLTNFETAEATVRASEAAVENARLQLEYCSIRSPIDGRTGKTLIQPGNMVKANDTNALLVINQLSPIYLNFAVPEQHLAAIRGAMASSTLKVDAMPAETREAAQSGELSFIDNTVDATTGTVRLRATFKNTSKVLWPGQFANAVLTLGLQSDALVVPSQAVQTGPKGQYVYVVSPDMVANIRAVAVDRVAGEETIIKKGLEAGEQVVTVGQLRIAPGAKVRAAAEAVAGTGKAPDVSGAQPVQQGAP